MVADICGICSKKYREKELRIIFAGKFAGW